MEHDNESSSEESSKYQVGGTHYVDMPVQPWSVMKSILTSEEYIGYLKGNIIRYSMRAGKKEGSDDWGKLKHYQAELEVFLASQDLW
jgi:hypothetical protein